MTELLPCPTQDELEKLCKDWVINKDGHIVTHGAVSNCKVAILAANALLKIVRSSGADGWQPIETAPKMKTIILFAVTSTDPENYRMASGFYHTGYENDARFSPWCWDGKQLMMFDTHPTHWMPLPQPPNVDAAAGEVV